MFIYDEIFRMNAFSDNNIGRYDTILYNSAGFDNTSSSDDGIFNCSFDQASIGNNRRSHLASFKILSRTGIVRVRVDRPVFVEKTSGIIQVYKRHICLIICVKIINDRKEPTVGYRTNIKIFGFFIKNVGKRVHR